MGGPPASDSLNGGRERNSLPPFRPSLGQREALPPIARIRGIRGLLLSLICKNPLDALHWKSFEALRNPAGGDAITAQAQLPFRFRAFPYDARLSCKIPGTVLPPECGHV